MTQSRVTKVTACCQAGRARLLWPPMNCGINAPTQRSRQLRLFSVENPLNSRLGAAFFRRLPAKPGVYFFYDATGGLLYIGQSNDLRARVGSYRHVTPEKHPQRTLR